MPLPHPRSRIKDDLSIGLQCVEVHPLANLQAVPGPSRNAVILAVLQGIVVKEALPVGFSGGGYPSWVHITHIKIENGWCQGNRVAITGARRG